MESQQQRVPSADREANRQALTCIAIAGVASCGLAVVFGLSAWLLAPPLYSWIAVQVAKATQPIVLYVNPDGTSRACDSWENACGLQAALGAAKEGDEIWVKAGVYRPTPDIRFPDATFQLKNGVAVYGGFAGTETDRNQRDWKIHVTVLSGDLGRDDTADPNGVVTATAKIVGPNAYHVVTGSGVDNTAILDGFTITAGYASVTPPNNHGYGGGMFNWAGSPTLNNLIFSGNTAGKGAPYYGGGGMFNIYSSNPVLTHVTFTAITAGSGGGMYNHASNPKLNDVTFSGNNAVDDGGMTNYMGSSPTLTDVTFSGNTAADNAGGMANRTNSNPVLKRVTFRDNSAGEYGRGMGNFLSSPNLADVEFSNNRAGREGGGMSDRDSSQPVLIGVSFTNNWARANGGGMLNSASTSMLTNVTFSGNSAGEYGGGICNTFSSGPKLTNVTVVGNEAPRGSAICNVGGSFRLVNGIVWGNTSAQEQVYNDSVTPDITYSDIEGGFPGACNLNVDPRFGALGTNRGATSFFALQTGSPVIDQGSPWVCPESDQLGRSRPADGDRDGSAICDMGAFEYQTPP